MKMIQTRTVPSNWLQQVNSFDIEKSTLSRNNKIIANILIEFIKSEEEKSLLNPLARFLISHIVFTDTFLNAYDSLPIQLIENGLSELKGEKGMNFNRKLHSVFIEFITYKKLKDYGYIWKDTNRTNGSCDLFLEKDDKTYNLEVKFKESNDILKSRLLDCIDGMSLLDEYSFSRGKTFEIHVKPENVNDTTQKEILEEIYKFLERKKDIYKGKHIDVFEISKRRELTRDINQIEAYISTLEISSKLTSEENIYEVIQQIFTNETGPITKLSNKSKKNDNFYGCLVWSIPFHSDINCENIKKPSQG